MKTMRIWIVIVVLLQGCATLQNPTTYAVCATLDVASTVAAVEAGFAEMNPIMAGLMSIGGYPLLIAANVGLIYVLYKRRDRKEVKLATGIGSVVRCGAAVNNVLLL